MDDTLSAVSTRDVDLMASFGVDVDADAVRAAGETASSQRRAAPVDLDFVAEEAAEQAADQAANQVAQEAAESVVSAVSTFKRRWGSSRSRSRRSASPPPPPRPPALSAEQVARQEQLQREWLLNEMRDMQERQSSAAVELPSEHASLAEVEWQYRSALEREAHVSSSEQVEELFKMAARGLELGNRKTLRLPLDGIASDIVRKMPRYRPVLHRIARDMSGGALGASSNPWQQLGRMVATQCASHCMSVMLDDSPAPSAAAPVQPRGRAVLEDP